MFPCAGEAAGSQACGINPHSTSGNLTMNISKREQRVLHALAQGGSITFDRFTCELFCFTREGYALTDCDLDLFRRLKRRRFVASRNSGPYRITTLGLSVVRSQFDNR
jgi:uncharacterized protein YjhX (UPF0386 family)